MLAEIKGIGTFGIYQCSRCKNEVWVKNTAKKPLVGCRCGKIRKVAEGEPFTDKRGREYLQLILFEAEEFSADDTEGSR